HHTLPRFVPFGIKCPPSFLCTAFPYNRRKWTCVRVLTHTYTNTHTHTHTHSYTHTWLSVLGCCFHRGPCSPHSKWPIILCNGDTGGICSVCVTAVQHNREHDRREKAREREKERESKQERG